MTRRAPLPVRGIQIGDAPKEARYMERAGRATAVLLILGFAGCSSMRINADYDTTVDFSTLKTYSWMERQRGDAEDPLMDNTLLEARVRAAVARELSAKGFPKVAAEEADFLVTYHVAREERFQLSTTGGPGWGWGSTTTHVHQYEEGTLILDIVSPQANMLLWRGTATAQIIESASPSRREKQINEAVEQILKRFPPEPK